METSKIFDYKLCRFKCDDNTLFRTDELISSIDELFSNLDLDFNLENQKGQGSSTFGIPKYWLLDTKGIDPLIKWIRLQILEASEFFGYKNATDIEIYQAFTNKMWPGSAGKVHDHTKSGHGVAVFYFQQPENGSDLVLVKDGYLGANLENISEENKKYLDVKQGDLVIHETTTWHGVSLHNGTSPRIVFILEYRYIL